MKLDDIKIDTILYGVHEHMYHADHNPAPYVEYVVTEELVKAHYEYKYKEIRTNDGYTPYYYQAKDFGKRIFFTPQEAAKIAEQMANEHDQTWMKYGEPPMRRTFEKYLKEGKKNDQ